MVLMAVTWFLDLLVLALLVLSSALWVLQAGSVLRREEFVRRDSVGLLLCARTGCTWRLDGGIVLGVGPVRRERRGLVAFYILLFGVGVCCVI